MGAKGFTLVELLVSMALLSMVMVGMLSVMRSMAQAQDRVEHRLDDSDDLRVATAFIDNVMGPVDEAIARFRADVLRPGDILFHRSNA